MESRAKIDALLDCLETVQADTLFVPTVYDGVAFYQSDLMPSRAFDSWVYLVPQAHARGIQVYAWIYAAYLGWQQQPAWNARLNHPGVPDDWLDFAVPEAREFVADVAYEVVSRYEADGVLLDYIRWRSWASNADLSAEDISLTVRGVYARLNGAAPLAAAVFAGQQASRERGQAWYTWLDGGYVDFVAPMAYVDDGELYALLGQWTDTGYFPADIRPILATAFFSASSEKPKTAEQVMGQIRLSRSFGATAILLFDDLHLCDNTALVQALQNGEW